MPSIHIPNLASRVLALNLKRLSDDWQTLYGHPLYLAETFDDPRHFKGTCYKAQGWSFLGHTRGFSKCSTRYYHHGFVSIAEWAGATTQSMLKRLGCRLNPKTRRYEPSSKPTILRLLQMVNADAVDQAFSDWFRSLTGEGLAVAIDGKTLKGADYPFTVKDNQPTLKQRKIKEKYP